MEEAKPGEETGVEADAGKLKAWVKQHKLLAGGAGVALLVLLYLFFNSHNTATSAGAPLGTPVDTSAGGNPTDTGGLTSPVPAGGNAPGGSSGGDSGIFGSPDPNPIGWPYPVVDPTQQTQTPSPGGFFAQPLLQTYVSGLTSQPIGGSPGGSAYRGITAAPSSSLSSSSYSAPAHLSQFSSVIQTQQQSLQLRPVSSGSILPVTGGLTTGRAS